MGRAPFKNFSFISERRVVLIVMPRCPTSNVAGALWRQFCVTKLVIFKYYMSINLFREDWLSVMFFQAVLSTLPHSCTRKKHNNCSVWELGCECLLDMWGKLTSPEKQEHHLFQKNLILRIITKLWWSSNLDPTQWLLSVTLFTLFVKIDDEGPPPNFVVQWETDMEEEEGCLEHHTHSSSCRMSSAISY